VPLHRFGSRHCRHLGLTVSSASSRFFHPNFLCSSLPLCLPVLQALATTSTDHRSSSPTPGMSLSHCAAASVCPRRHHLARRSPFFMLELPPPVPPHLVARLDANGRATARSPVRGDHPVCAPRRIDRSAGPPLWPWATVRGRSPCPLGQRTWDGSSPTLCLGF
jgi:hypothetical protein